MSKQKREPFLTTRGKKAVAILMAIAEAGESPFEHFDTHAAICQDLGDEIPLVLSEVMEAGGSRAQILAAGLLLKRKATEARFIPDAGLIARAEQIVVRELQSHSGGEICRCCRMLSQVEYVPEIAIRELQRLSGNDDETTRVCAAAALCICGGPASAIAVSILGRTLHSADEDNVAIAAAAFTRLGMRQDAAIPELIRALGTGREETKFYVLAVLQRLGPLASAAIPAVSSLLQAETLHPFVQGRAATALGSIAKGQKSGVAVLMKALRSKHWQVVKGAAEGLALNGCYGDEAILTLGKLLSADKEELRGTAAIALRHFGPRAAPAIPMMVGRFGAEPSIDVCNELAMTFGAVGVAAIPPLVNLIRTDDVRQLPLVAASLRAIGEEAAAALGEFMLRQPSDIVRTTGALILRDMGEKAAPAVPALVNLLDGATDGESAGFIVCAITVCGAAAASAADALVRCLVKWNHDIAGIARGALQKIGERALVALEAAQRTASGEAKRRIEGALAYCGSGPQKRFARLERLNRDDLLKLFVLVGDVFERKGETSWRTVAALIRDKLTFTRANGMPMGKGDNSIAKAIRDLAGFLESPAVPLTTHTEKRKGLLTKPGERLLREAKQYLEQKYGSTLGMDYGN